MAAAMKIKPSPAQTSNVHSTTLLVFMVLEFCVFFVGRCFQYRGRGHSSGVPFSKEGPWMKENWTTQKHCHDAVFLVNLIVFMY